MRPLLFLTALFLLSNCQDDYEETTQGSLTTQAGATHRIITGKEARTKTKELVAYLKEKGIKLTPAIQEGGLEYRTLADIEDYIDDSEVYEIHHGDDVNYTYNVRLPDTTGLRFYNMVIKQKDGFKRTELITYEMDPAFAADYYSGKAAFEIFTGRMTVEILSIDEGFPCDEEPSTPIPISGGNGPGGAGGGGGGGGTGGTGNNNPPNTYNSLADAQYNSLAILNNQADDDANGDDSDNGDDEDDDDDAKLVSRSPRYYRLPEIPPTTGIGQPGPCGEADQVGILEPQLTTHHEKNCEELNDFMNDVNVRSSYNNLKNTVSENRENGYGFSDNAIPEELELADGSLNMLYVPTGGSYYGASHTHPNQHTTEFVPMFSISDIFKLGQLAADYEWQPGTPRNYNKFVLTLTAQQGGSNSSKTYALKIDNWISFAAFCNSYQTMTNKERRAIEGLLKYNYTREVTASSGTEEYLKILLKFMEQKSIKGVSVYKANDELTEWSKQTLDENGNGPVSTPCAN